MSFTVLLHPSAAKSLKKLHAQIRSRILESVKELEGSPEKGGQLKPSQFWRLRIGDYRVIYEIDRPAKRIVVLHIGHRKKVVKRVDASVKRGAFPSRSEALRTILEGYLGEHPELFLESDPEELLGSELSDRELEKIGARVFSGIRVARLVAEGRGR